LREFARQNRTIRDVARQLANAGTAPMMAGTPKDIADEMEAWVTAGAADGFNLMFPLIPEEWQKFAELVAPELQRRGLVGKEYASGTLRERLGLTKPSNQYRLKAN
jgi:alkanesulfonate monooxygenase SsuD/methylene tetrahydromethanopterin reductase-like flavin-dependent oxidoreductase (luciferase family)